MSEQAEAVVKQFDRAVEEHDWDTLRDLVTDDFVQHDPQSIAEEPIDIEELIETIEAFEWRFELQDIFSDGDKVVTREIMHGTQIDAVEGLPPGNEVSTRTILIWRVEDGKVAEVWSEFDTYTFMEQLGATFPGILVTVPKMLVRKLLP